MNSLTLTEERLALQERRATFGTRLLAWVELIERRIERQRQRRALMALDDRLLRDIGIDRGEALTQGSKPFWVD